MLAYFLAFLCLIGCAATTWAAAVLDCEYDDNRRWDDEPRIDPEDLLAFTAQESGPKRGASVEVVSHEVVTTAGRR